MRRRRLGRATTHLWAEWGRETQLLRGRHLCNNIGFAGLYPTPLQPPRQGAQVSSLWQVGMQGPCLPQLCR